MNSSDQEPATRFQQLSRRGMRWFERRAHWQIWLISSLLIGLAALLDWLTGIEIGSSLLYVAPILLLTWCIHRRAGLLGACMSAGLWAMINRAEATMFNRPWIHSWNIFVRFATFALLSYVLGELHSALKRERQLARTDSLTGSVNSRFFYALLEDLLHAGGAGRCEGSLVAIDLDGFKQVNDQFGHPVSDAALQVTAATICRVIRRSDVLARLGGDEFAILLPDTSFSASQQVLERIQRALLEEYGRQGWPLSASIGVVPMRSEQSSTELLRQADQALYAAKRAGKNRIHYAAEGPHQ